MKKIMVSEWVSLDGVFDASTMSQWFDPYESEERGKEIAAMTHEADVFLMGSVTYDMLARYWAPLKHNEFGIADKLNTMPKFVVATAPLQAEWNNTTVIDGNDAPLDAIAALKQSGDGTIMVAGSATLVYALMERGLVDEYRYLVHPIIAGSGKRFFKDDMPAAKLVLAESRQLPNGVVSLKYTRAHEGEK